MNTTPDPLRKETVIWLAEPVRAFVDGTMRGSTTPYAAQKWVCVGRQADGHTSQFALGVGDTAQAARMDAFKQVAGRRPAKRATIQGDLAMDEKP